MKNIYGMYTSDENSNDEDLFNEDTPLDGGQVINDNSNYIKTRVLIE